MAADYLILGNPSAYTIYNQYEQQLSVTEKKMLPANSPFEIITENDRLGDQITPVLRTKSNRQTFCFLLDENSALAGDKNNSYRERIKNGTPLGKQAKLLTDIIIDLPNTKNSIRCAKGSSLVVLFSSNKRYYVQIVGTTPRYGWCATSANISFDQSNTIAETQPLPQASQPLSPLLRRLLISRFDKANQTYQAFFTTFNNSTRLDKTIPVWQLQSTDSLELRYTLNNPYKTNEELTNSTRILTEDLKKIAAGKQLFIQQNNGEITIRATAP